MPTGRCRGSELAIRLAESTGRVAIRYRDQYRVCSQRACDRLTASGVPFAYLCEVVRGPRRFFVTVPVND